MEYRQDDIQLALRFIEIENEIDQLTNDYGRTARTAVRLLGDAIRAR